MPSLIKNRQLVLDPANSNCQHLDLEQPLPTASGTISVPLARWQDPQQREALRFHNGRVGVRLSGADDVALLADDLDKLELIVLDFSRFTDGRGYSQARRLRERYGYRGELRAVGEVLRDQLYFMVRCGIDAFELAQGQNPAQALAALEEITVHYQPTGDGLVSIADYRLRRAAS